MALFAFVATLLGVASGRSLGREASKHLVLQESVEALECGADMLKMFAPRRHKDATVVPAGDGLDVGSASAAAAKEFLGLTGLTETTKPGAGVLTCAKHFKVKLADGKLLKPCAPVDFDLKNVLPEQFFTDAFMFPHESKDAAAFVADLGAHDECYHLPKLPGFGTNYAVLVGMTPARNEWSAKATPEDLLRFYSVQSDICATYQMLLGLGLPRRNIVVFTFTDAFKALEQSSEPYFWHKAAGGKGVGIKCKANMKTVPVDYSGHMLGDGASMSDKWEDMETNDKITVPMVQAVLNGDTAYLTASCARSSAMVESGAVRCSGRAIRSGKHDNVLVHLNGHGGSNDVDLGPLGDAQLNSLFLGDTHYPDSLSKMPWYSMVYHASQLGLKAWMGAERSTKNSGVTGTVASKAFFASLSKTFKDHKDAGRHNKFAVYINACKSGGLFDAESGAGNMLQDANTYVLASAPKKDPSSTFTPAMVKQQSFQNAVSNTAAKAKVVTSTFFANFWHNSVMRNSPLEMTHEQERQLMEGLGAVFSIFKKGTRRSNKGWQASRTLGFHPQGFGAFQGDPVGDIVVAPLFRHWYRKEFESLQAFKFRYCVERPRHFKDPKRENLGWGGKLEPLLRAEKEAALLNQVLKLAKTDNGVNRAKIKRIVDVNLIADKKKLATKLKRDRAAISQLFQAPQRRRLLKFLRLLDARQLDFLVLHELGTDAKQRVDAMHETMKTLEEKWKGTTDYFGDWLLGDMQSTEFQNLENACSANKVHAHAATDVYTREQICECVGYKAPGVPSMYRYPESAPWQQLYGGKDELTSKQLNLTVSVVSAVSLRPKSGGSVTNMYNNHLDAGCTVEVQIHRGAVTPKDAQDGIKPDTVQKPKVAPSIDKTNHDLSWAEPEPLIFQNVCDTLDPDVNRDTLRITFKDQENQVLGVASAAVAAFLGEEEHVKTYTIPLHVDFAGKDKIGSTCKQEAKQQPDYCASYHEWIPNKDVLAWQIRNTNTNALHMRRLFTGKAPGGKLEISEIPIDWVALSSEQEDKRAEATIATQCAPVTRDGKKLEGNCIPFYTYTDRGKKAKTEFQDYGLVTFQIKIETKADA